MVVGAGPGGSATAHYLARRGLDVLLLDKSDFPRDKTCGDGLTPRALRVLDDMNILPEVAAQGFAIGGYRVVAPNGRTTTARLNGAQAALAVPRLKLDDIILRRAMASGADFESRVSVARIESVGGGSVSVHAEDGRRFSARAAVVATGAATAVLARSGILRHQPRAMLAARTYFERIREPLDDLFQLRFDHVPLPGYGWLFPVGPGVANLGVGFLPRGRGSRRPATASFERFVQGGPLQQLLAGAQRVGPVRGFPIRVDFLSAPTSGPRTLLVGEAAGLVNPLTGEGIDYALESAQIAAEHIATGLASTDSLDASAYDRALRARFEKVFRFSEIVRDWYCFPPLLNVLVPLAEARPGLRQMLAEVVLGEREPAGYGPLSILTRLGLYLARQR